jgi:beta-galactosidase
MSLLYKDEIMDTIRTAYGYRTIAFDADTGFYLNGEPVKLKGVCLHHDLGALGAADNRYLWKQRLEMLKEMGCNAVRITHNPASQSLLDLCAETGMLVIEESFDTWAYSKNWNLADYAACYNSQVAQDHLVNLSPDWIWAQADIYSMVWAGRNNPAVIMWSIGNEIGEQKEEHGWKLARKLADTVRAIDPTRPVTAGCDRYPYCLDNRLAFYLDVLSLNYKPLFYPEVRKNYPNLPLLGSETASCITTRGVYHLPAEVVIGYPKHDDLTLSDYGMSATRWAYYPEREWTMQQECEYVMGEFVWTGFDYLGEPTPYYGEWPSRSSYFGVVDLAGLPKNRYFGYRSAWTNTPTLHIFPHWNWEGMEGKVVPVHVYTNFEEVELFINGVSQGKRRHATSGTDVTAQLERFRLMWNDTVYAPGEVCAVAYQNGKEVAREVVRTAGAPHHVVLSSYWDKITADSESLNYITATIVDENGILCPLASNRLTFSAVGAASVYATDAGDQRETESFLRPDKKALSGMLVACLRACGTPGTVTVTCSADGLKSDSITLDCV